ncbi:unnamed protein product [Chrysodeixis includens]|uniref:Uncharacterized protein n=1 Tax=Chrysodeixis includens TaxID=689277 RepID=A0A9N8KUT9_CHRIL|nr:unnamed protein product [Chrysodeixis includens]
MQNSCVGVLVRGLHSEGERVECAECGRCGGRARSRVPAAQRTGRARAGSCAAAARLPAGWTGPRRGHHAAWTALDESEKRKTNVKIRLEPVCDAYLLLIQYRPFGESRMVAPLFESTEPLYNNNNSKKSGGSSNTECGQITRRVFVQLRSALRARALARALTRAPRTAYSLTSVIPPDYAAN